MVDETQIVITRPNWERATWYGAHWLKKVVDDFGRLGLSVTDLEGDLAIKAEVDVAIDATDPVYFTGVGHGNADTFTGQEYSIIFKTCNCDKLIDRDSYLLSCMTAQRLGSDIIEKGGLSYSGYWISYTFCIEDVEDQDLDDQDKAFADTVAFSNFLYGRTATRKTDFELRKELARLWIKFWETQPDGSSIIHWLGHDELTEGVDRDSKLYGDETRRRTATISHRPVVMLIRRPKQPQSNPSQVAIAVACPQKCDLTGKIVQLIDNNGAVVAEKPLSLFQNGLYWTGLFQPTFAESGRVAYICKFLGDETHPTEESLPQIFLVQGTANIHGKVTEAETGEPVADATVGIDMISTKTDANGEYSATVKAPQTYQISVQKFCYWPETKTISAQPGQTHEVNLALTHRAFFTLNINTEVDGKPSNLQVNINYKVHPTPYAREWHDKNYIILVFDEEQTRNGVKYTWSHWKEDGDTRNRRDLVISRDTTLTGVYTTETPPPPPRKGKPWASPLVAITYHPRPEQEDVEGEFTFPKTEYTSGEEVAPTCKLWFLSDGAPLVGREVTLYEDGIEKDTQVTDEAGLCTFSWIAPNVPADETHEYQAKFAGDP